MFLVCRISQSRADTKTCLDANKNFEGLDSEIYLLFFYFLPLAYLAIYFFQVRKAGRKARAVSVRRRKSERKITRMVVVVVAVFVLCWLPFYILNIVNLLVLLPGEFRGLYYFVVVLSYANSCANPILYGFLSDNFKRGFRKALCRSSRRVENLRGA